MNTKYTTTSVIQYTTLENQRLFGSESANRLRTKEEEEETKCVNALFCWWYKQNGCPTKGMYNGADSYRL